MIYVKEEVSAPSDQIKALLFQIKQTHEEGWRIYWPEQK